MSESAAAVVRQRARPEPHVYTRNLLADFDALLERALVANADGRNPEPFLSDACRIAARLAQPCEHRPEHQVDPVGKASIRNLVERAFEAQTWVDEQLLAFAAKSKARRFTNDCDCTRRDLSKSGKPIF